MSRLMVERSLLGGLALNIRGTELRFDLKCFIRSDILIPET
jgi:hypothetical protein